MAHKNQNNKFAVELTLRLRITRTQPRSKVLRKWILALLTSVLVKAVHFYFSSGVIPRDYGKPLFEEGT